MSPRSYPHEEEVRQADRRLGEETVRRPLQRRIGLPHLHRAGRSRVRPARQERRDCTRNRIGPKSGDPSWSFRDPAGGDGVDRVGCRLAEYRVYDTLRIRPPSLQALERTQPIPDNSGGTGSISGHGASPLTRLSSPLTRYRLVPSGNPCSRARIRSANLDPMLTWG